MNIYHKVWQLLTKSQKLSSVRLTLLTVIGAIFEAAGIGLIVPFISVVANDNFELPNSILTILPVLNSLDSEGIIIFVVGLFLIFYFFKSLFLLYLAAIQAGLLHSFARVYFYTVIRVLSQEALHISSAE